MNGTLIFSHTAGKGGYGPAAEASPLALSRLELERRAPVLRGGHVHAQQVVVLRVEHAVLYLVHVAVHLKRGAGSWRVSDEGKKKAVSDRSRK